MSNSVQVELQERSYPIWIGTNELPLHLDRLLQHMDSVKHAFLVNDPHLQNVVDRLTTEFAKQEIRTSSFVVPSGESSKSIEQLSNIWNAMLEAKSDRKSIVVAVGGGVVGDLAGFASATFMRGIRFAQIPTTLLAMVDSSVGGKTGINLPASKNVIGAFWQPHAVVIETSLLNSLPDREYRSGVAEIVKYGVILDAALFDYIEEHIAEILDRDPKCLEHLIKRSCELKAHVVANDERETTGLRAILNYGHTFGHAIEAISSYGTFLHGEAISIGMTMAGSLAVDLGMWSEEEFVRQTELLEKLLLPTHCRIDLPTESMLRAMQSDKKNEHGVLNLILPTRIGEVRSVRSVAQPSVRKAIEQYSPAIP